LLEYSLLEDEPIETDIEKGILDHGPDERETVGEQ